MTCDKDQIEVLIKRLRFDSNDVCNAYSSTIADRIQDAADALAAQAARIDELMEQHHKDSAELRNLCEARDQARRTAEYWKAEHNAGNARIAELERDAGMWRTLLDDMAKEFVRVYPIYYYAEPWAHDRNEVLKRARVAIAAASKGEEKS